MIWIDLLRKKTLANNLIAVKGRLMLCDALVLQQEFRFEAFSDDIWLAQSALEVDETIVMMSEVGCNRATSLALGSEKAKFSL